MLVEASLNEDPWPDGEGMAHVLEWRGTSIYSTAAIISYRELDMQISHC